MGDRHCGGGNVGHRGGGKHLFGRGKLLTRQRRSALKRTERAAAGIELGWQGEKLEHNAEREQQNTYVRDRDKHASRRGKQDAQKYQRS